MGGTMATQRRPSTQTGKRENVLEAFQVKPEPQVKEWLGDKDRGVACQHVLRSRGKEQKRTFGLGENSLLGSRAGTRGEQRLS